MNKADIPIVERLRKSTSQRDVAVTLGSLLIEQVAPDNQANRWLRTALSSMGQVIWGDRYNPAKGDSYDKIVKKKTDAEKAIKAVLGAAPDDEAKRKLAEAYTRLGHLYEIAGHVARENFFLDRERKLAEFAPTESDRVPPKELMTPGGVHELLFHNIPFLKSIAKDTQGDLSDSDVTKAVTSLSRPVSEYVFTQHPTNTNLLDSMKLQRAIAKNVDALVHGGEDVDALKKNIAAFAHTDIVQAANFTAKDETEIVINFLSNAYQDMDRLYEVTERGLSRKFGEEYNDEQRQALDLKLHFGSWGSAGDKDGNNNLKSEHTLEAIVMHKKEAAKMLLKELRETGNSLLDYLKPWEANLEQALKDYTELFDKIEKIRDGKNDIPLTNKQFLLFSENAQTISEHVLGNVEDFQADLKKAVADTSGEQKNKLLSLERKVRVFGFNLGKIEYRETAEEYGRVFAYLLSKVTGGKLHEFAQNYLAEYKKYTDELKKDEDKRNGDEISQSEAMLAYTLTNILTEPGLRAEFIAHAQETLDGMQGENLRTYKVKDEKTATPEEQKITDQSITYHTLRRMELARDFGDMITHNVLAECKGTHNLLEALAMQVVTTQSDGKRAKMHIVPLFEEAETMAKIPDVLSEGLENEAYNKHVRELKARDNAENITQQIQIAHSDNARRAGAIASRGIIHEGHSAAREAIRQYNEKHADNQVNLQFFEGGSLSDSYRNGVRAVTAMTKDFDLGEFSKFTFQGGDLLNYFNQPTSMERLTLRGVVQQAELLNIPHNVGHHGPLFAFDSFDVQEEEVRNRLSRLQKEYETNFYDSELKIAGRLLRDIGYYDHIAAGNAGTRGGARKVLSDADKKKPVAVKDIRTIGFSETFQHEGIHPTFLGAGEIRQALQNGLNEGNEISAKQWRVLYAQSASFRDVIDKLAYSVMNSDIKQFTDRYERKITAGTLERDQIVSNYIHLNLPQQYIEVGKIVFEALTGEEFLGPASLPPSHGLMGGERLQEVQRIEQETRRISGFAYNTKTPTNNIAEAADRMRYLIKNVDAMQKYEALNYKHSYVDGLGILETSLGKAVDGAESFFSRLFHNARDTLYHGRTFVADDPFYGKTLTAMKRAQQRTSERSATI